VVAITRGALGCVVARGDELEVVPAVPIDSLVDTTGAGDLFAAGFLYGFTAGEPLRRCGELGAKAAAAVITTLGPRPQQSLSSLK
jgi:sugar/nucleoside kinase (ribokinase family)